MEDPRIQELLNKHAANTCTPAELAELHRWYDAFPPEGEPKDKAAYRQAAKQAVLRAIGEPPVKRRWARAWSAAAAVAVLVCCAWWAMQRGSAPPVMVEVHAPAGDSVRTVQLPDGSRAWLAAGSTIRYRKGFEGGDRTVELPDGQVFFDVEQMTEHPFIVKTARGVIVKVLGTAFSVTTWPELHRSDVYVASGAVQVSDSMGTTQVLQAKERLAVEPGMPLVVQADDRPDPRSGVDVLKDADFATIAAFVKRRFGIALRYDAGAMGHIRFNVFTDKDMTAPQFFELLQSISGIPFRVEGNTVTFFTS